MKIPISKAREKLPKLIRELQKHPGQVYEITSRNEVVARLTAPPLIEPGQTAAGLLSLRKKWRGRIRKQPTPYEPVSEHIDAYVYDDILSKKKSAIRKSP
jgi:antitoxin (DNA-binding transcriptional repressor) of toxin-antitoxin stability system